MAKKDEYQFKIPTFDDEEIAMREIFDSKLGGFLIAYAVAVSFVSYLIIAQARLDNAGGIAFLLVVLAILVVRRVVPFVFDGETLDKFYDTKKIVGSSFLIFFLWLSVTTILINPPISDLTGPIIDDIRVYPFGDEDNATSFSSSQFVNATNVTVRASVLDNMDLEGVTITITGGPNLYDEPMVEGDMSIFTYDFLLQDRVEVTIEAWDHLDQRSTYTREIPFGLSPI